MIFKKMKQTKLKTLATCESIEEAKQAGNEWIKFIQTEVDEIEEKINKTEYEDDDVDVEELIDEGHKMYHQGSIDILETFCNFQEKKITHGLPGKDNNHTIKGEVKQNEKNDKIK